MKNSYSSDTDLRETSWVRGSFSNQHLVFLPSQMGSNNFFFFKSSSRSIITLLARGSAELNMTEPPSLSSGNRNPCPFGSWSSFPGLLTADGSGPQWERHPLPFPQTIGAAGREPGVSFCVDTSLGKLGH